MDAGSVICFSIAGACIGILLSCMPGLHVASVLAVFLCALEGSPFVSAAVPLSVGMSAAYVVTGFIPVAFASVPDDGVFAATNPMHALLRQGRGIEGVLLGGAGALIGILAAVVALSFHDMWALSSILAILRPHWHWLVWAATVFMLMSEWPMRAGPGLGMQDRFFDAWRRLAPGLLVFMSSSLLGIIVFFRIGNMGCGSFANIMPMVSGMFSVPWLVLAALDTTRLPKQVFSGRIRASSREIATGSMSGCLGGMFACVVPGITAGVGGLLAGHACSLRSTNAFIVAQGAARSVYICGALLLMFLPGITAIRGGCAMMLASVHEPCPHVEFAPVAGALLLSAGLSLCMARPMSRLFVAIITICGKRVTAAASLVIVAASNAYVTGVAGLVVMLVASLIGVSAMLYGARRMNCLGCILVPVGIALSGIDGLVL